MNVGDRTSDVSIVGASSGGLLTGILLARAGLDVTVHERSRDIQPAYRTLIVTDSYNHYLGHLGRSAILNRITGYELHCGDVKVVLPLDRPDLIVERAALARELAKELENEGGRVLLGRRFVGLGSEAGRPFVQIKEDGLDGPAVHWANHIVAADGARSSVAKAAGFPLQPTAPLLHAVAKMPPNYRSDTAVVWFRPGTTSYFIWMIPESDDRAVIGIIGEDKHTIHSTLVRFCEQEGFTPMEFQGACIPIYQRWTPTHKSFGNGRIHAVGDAAGQVKVTTVGGLVTGFRGAIGTAEMILDGSSREHHALRRELDLHLLVRRVLRRFDESDYSHLLRLLDDKSSRILATVTRDETPRLLLRLLRAKPKLALIALQALITRGPNV